jgi:hypothetical protein
MGRACSTYGRGKRCIQGLGRKKEHLDDSDVDAKIILKCIFSKWEGGMDWIDLAENRERYRALVNVVMKLWAP